MIEAGTEYVVMEVSSQSLKLHRVDGVEFDVVLFTNFSEDHISPNEHPDMEDYFKSKAKLFEMCKNGIINTDDLKGNQLLKLFPDNNITTYGIDNGANVLAKDITITNSYVDFKVKLTDRNERVKTGIPGRFSVYNSLAAICVAKRMGIDSETIKEALLEVRVPGRSELVENKLEIPIMIDYAHSPESLQNILQAVKSYTRGRVISGFGCGGDRDTSKRAIMGEISGRIADYTFITSDNPRTEDPEKIVEQIEEALENNINARSRSSVKIELAEDELHRMNFEADRLHVSNNVLDNCFSTLKHETMYYPSRIRQMVENNSRDVGTLHEITAYYKELYMLLSLQAQRQLETNVRMDKTILTYLMSLLRKLSGEKMPNIVKADIDRTYCLLTVEMPGLRLTEEQVSQLFTPQTCQLTCLIVRQIIREAGDTTHPSGCGVSAEQRADGGTDIIITISRKVKLAPYIPYTEASNSNA